MSKPMPKPQALCNVGIPRVLVGICRTPFRAKVARRDLAISPEQLGVTQARISEIKNGKININRFSLSVWGRLGSRATPRNQVAGGGVSGGPGITEIGFQAASVRSGVTW